MDVVSLQKSEHTQAHTTSHTQVIRGCRQLSMRMCLPPVKLLSPAR